MEKVFLSRRNLESMSTADLISLSDDYGIDIPESLSRSFIIGELLAVADELDDGSKKDEPVELSGDVERENTLPVSYNETSVHVLLRNPAWAFVYWDISESELERIEDDFLSDSVFLHVRYFKTFEDEKPVDAFDIHVPLSDRERYILLSQVGACFDVQLVVHDDQQIRILAETNRREAAPACCKAVQELPNRTEDMSELRKLSGMEHLLHEHYLNHRQSFS